jgi:hypothetical protein
VSLQEISNDNGVIVVRVNFAISKNLIVKSMMLPHRNIHKFILPGSDQILAEVIQTGSQILCSKTHKLINSVWNKDKLLDPVESVYYCTSS